MADLNLTQDEANRLMKVGKKPTEHKEWTFPAAGERIVVPLESLDRRDSFLLDLTRYQIRLTKATFQNRAHVAIILYRLDVDGPPHRNPDGEEISCPHLHIYREGYGDKWAVAAPLESFPNPHDLFGTFDDFMTLCNVVERPQIMKGLFS